MTPTPDREPAVDRQRVLAVTFVPVAILLAVVLVAHLVAGLALEEVMEDPAGLHDFHPLTGAISTIGIVIWWSAAVACLLTAALVVPRGASARHRSFLLWSGILTGVLVLDDLFLFHEDLAMRYLGLGQRFIVIAYLIVAALYVVRFGRVIWTAPERWLLGLSVALLAASLATDYVHERVIFDRTGEYLGLLIFVEDAFKLLGIAAWTAFFVRYGYRAVVRSRPLRMPVDGAASEPPLP